MIVARGLSAPADAALKGPRYMQGSTSMTRVGRWTLAGAVVAMMSAGSAPAQIAQAACDRACLRDDAGSVSRCRDQARPQGCTAQSSASARRRTRSTCAPGDGVWKTVTGLGKMQRRYLDPVSGQAGYYGLVDEGGSTAVVTVRLRVENRTAHRGRMVSRARQRSRPERTAAARTAAGQSATIPTT